MKSYIIPRLKTILSIVCLSFKMPKVFKKVDLIHALSAGYRQIVYGSRLTLERVQSLLKEVLDIQDIEPDDLPLKRRRCSHGTKLSPEISSAIVDDVATHHFFLPKKFMVLIKEVLIATSYLPSFLVPAHFL